MALAIGDMPHYGFTSFGVESSVDAGYRVCEFCLPHLSTKKKLPTVISYPVHACIKFSGVPRVKLTSSEGRQRARKSEKSDAKWYIIRQSFGLRQALRGGSSDGSLICADAFGGLLVSRRTYISIVLGWSSSLCSYLVLVLTGRCC